MQKQRNASQYIAGICFLIYAAIYIYYIVIFQNITSYLLTLIPALVIGIAAFIASPVLAGIGAVIGGVFSASSAVRIFSYLIEYNTPLTLAPIVLGVVFWIFLVITAFSRLHPKTFGILSFVCGLLRFVLFIVNNVIEYGHPSIRFLVAVGYLLPTIGALLLGFAFEAKCRGNAQRTVNGTLNSQVPTAAPVVQTPTDLNADSRLDRIVRLKALFDSGAITEEEFTAKKREILGM